MKISEALRKIADDIATASGYPYPDRLTDRVDRDPMLAYAYGLTWGMLMAAARDWESREAGQVRER